LWPNWNGATFQLVDALASSGERDEARALLDGVARLPLMRLALDDFGTGYYSLSYLRKLPLDVLKIDRSFVMEIGLSRNGNSLVNAIVPMAAALGLNTLGQRGDAGGARSASASHFGNSGAR